MKKYCFFLILIVFSSCYQNSFEKFKLSEKEKIVNRVERKVTSNLQRKYGLIPFGSGGQMMYQVQWLMLDFNYPKPLTEDEARVLVVNATEDFLAAINEEEALRQYLANYPFGPKNVEISIFLQDSRGTCVQPDKFTLIKISDGFVVCKANNFEKKESRIVFKETFEEAKRKTMGQLQ